MYDPKYATWLKDNHPAEVPLQLNENPLSGTPVPSVTEFFSNVSPIEELVTPCCPPPDVTLPPSAASVLSPCSHTSTSAP